MTKGEYREIEEEQDHVSTNSTPHITNNTPPFLKYHNYPHFLPLHHSQPQQQFQTTETAPPSKKPKPPTTTSSEDGGTIELSRRPRGRPPGSKNKPKPPIILTHQPDPLMSPYILELQPGSDLVESLTRFTRHRSLSICVINATGTVVNVTLKQPTTPSYNGGTVTFHGRFEILSLSSCIMAQTVPFSDRFGFTVSLAGPQGQIIGGKIVGPLFCAGTVYVVATSFNNPAYCRLPVETDDNNNSSSSNNNNNNETDRVTDADGSGGSGTHVGLYSEVGWASHSVRPPQLNYE